MRVLVTGAAGFLARALVPRLAERHEVVALARSASLGRLDERVEGIAVDLSEGLDRERLPARVDAVVHLAQSEHFRAFPERAHDIFAVNVAATADLLDYARTAGAQRLVLASSGGVCAPASERLADDVPPRPGDFYQRTKAAAEVLAGAYESCFATLVLRPFFIYGPGQVDRLMPNLAARVRRGEEVVVSGDPGIAINPIYVDDAAAAFDAAIESGASGTLNVAGGEDITIGALARLLAELDGREAIVRHDPATAVAGDLLADTTGMRERLGVEPRVVLRDGLRRTLDALPASAPGLS